MMSCVDASSYSPASTLILTICFISFLPRILVSSCVFAVNKTRDVKVTSLHFWGHWVSHPFHAADGLVSRSRVSRIVLPYAVIGFAVWGVAISQNFSIPCIVFCFGFWGSPFPAGMKCTYVPYAVSMQIWSYKRNLL